MSLARLSALLFAAVVLPWSASAQQLEEAPKVILDGVRFRVEVSAQLETVRIEVRDNLGALLGQGEAAQLQTAIVDGLVVTDRAQLPSMFPWVPKPWR